MKESHLQLVLLVPTHPHLVGVGGPGGQVGGAIPVIHGGGTL